MERYKFLFKPIFFIFNLLFATWLVLYIEKIQPSDFGKYESFFAGPKPKENTQSYDKKYLQKLYDDYRSGKIDSAAFNKGIEKILIPVSSDVTTEKQKEGAKRNLIFFK